jgi:transcriptional regulator
MGSERRQAADLLPGSVDLLILKALVAGPRHGYAIARYIRDASDEALSLGESSLYTALQRLLLKGWVQAEWGSSDSNRRARYYTLTTAGKRHLAAETRQFDELVGAIQRVLHAT